MPNSTPILAGLGLRCGQCGKGKLFAGYLRLHTSCPVCGRDMTAADTADGPAFFVGFGVLVLLAPFLFLLPMSPLPVIAKAFAFAALCAVLIGLCLVLLPIAKAVLLNLQLHHDAEEVTASDIEDR